MSYTPNVWQAGDVVTPAKLNHIEEGIASSGLVIHQTVDAVAGTKTMDKTWQEIHDAVEAGSSAVLIGNDQGFLTISPVSAVGVADGEWLVSVVDFTTSSTLHYAAPSASGYPVAGGGGPK